MTYVEVKPWEARLGNVMFQYAAAKSLADGGDVAFVIEREEWWPSVEKFRTVFPDLTIVAKAPEGAEVLEGLFQDVKYLKPEIVARLFGSLRDEVGRIPAGTVSIHVRRGDYLDIPHHHPFVGEDYLRKAVGRFPEETRFMVFSDDIPWCRRFFKGPRFEFSEGRTALEDLALMVACDHHICSNSTYSWWGAYLGHRGRVVFPSVWLGPALFHVDTRGLYFEGVEVVANHLTPVLWAKASLLILRAAVRRVRRWMGSGRSAI